MFRTLVVIGGSAAAVVVLAVLGWYTYNCWPMIRQNFPWLGEESPS